jgi:Cellulase (glycosyl hydrolase family 5)
MTGIQVRLCLITLAACCVSNRVIAGPWNAGVDERNGLPVLSKGGAMALSSEFVFWGKNWAFADQQTDFKVRAPFAYTVAGKNQTLNFALAARITKMSDRQLIWEFDLDAANPMSGVIGGGISFAFDLADFGSELGEPKLLPGNLGWVWGHAGGTNIQMRFDRPLAAVYFERGQKSEVRAFFYKDDIPQGHRFIIATMDISSDVALSPTVLERFGADDSTDWPTGIMSLDKAPVDLSFLNTGEAPAGKRGVLQVRGGKLVFEDGTVARFWGTNLTAYSLFATSKDDIKRQAHRLSQLGFNLVRLHHHDSEWVDPNIFGDRNSRSTQKLDEAMLEKLDWWVKCLKDEGIYVWLDLHVGRRVKPADGIDGFPEISQGRPTAGLFGYNYVNQSIRDAMKRFNEMYLNHQNRYTGIRYKDEPAIVALLITNENDLTNHYGNDLLPDKGVPKHTALYMREAENFAGKYGLPKDKVWRSWEDGPSKLFLNDLEERFDIDMIAHLRSLGAKAPIVTTSTWGLNPLNSLPALTAGDIIDVHSYGGVGELDKNPVFGANLVDWIAAAQIAGKPLTVTEWGVESHGSLAPDRQDIPLYIASSAAMQGWDAVMFFAYSQEPLSDRGGTPSIYQAYDDPALMASLPAAALLYRQGHVKEAITTYVFAPSKEMLFDRSISPANSVALRTAVERGKLLIAMPKVPQLPWLEKSIVPSGATLISNPQQSQIPVGAATAVSDSGELERNWDQGTFTIKTPRTQAAMGWIGGKRIALPQVELDVTSRNAVVAVQSLDEKPIDHSREIMLSIGARSVPLSDKSLPFYSEPVVGQIMVTARPGMHLRAWDARTGKLRPVAASYRDGRYILVLDRSIRSSWLLLGDPQRKDPHISTN